MCAQRLDETRQSSNLSNRAIWLIETNCGTFGSFFLNPKKRTWTVPGGKQPGFRKVCQTYRAVKEGSTRTSNVWDSIQEHLRRERSSVDNLVPEPSWGGWRRKGNCPWRPKRVPNRLKQTCVAVHRGRIALRNER